MNLIKTYITAFIWLILGSISLTIGIFVTHSILGIPYGPVAGVLAGVIAAIIILPGFFWWLDKYC